MIYFRQVNEPHSTPGAHWHVEYYCDEGTMFPVGTAYVFAINERQIAQLSFILVADKWRRGRIAAAILEACKEKWPFLTATSPMSEAGQELVRKYDLWQPEHEENGGEVE